MDRLNFILYTYKHHSEISDWKELDASERKRSVLHNTHFWASGNIRNYTIICVSSGIKDLNGNYDQIIGIGSIGVYSPDERWNQQVWLEHLEIFPEHVRQGYGKLLLSKLEAASASDVKESVKKNYYAKVMDSELRFYLSCGYDEISMKKGKWNQHSRSSSERRYYAKPFGQHLDQEKLYFEIKPDYELFEYACQDSRKEAVNYIPYFKEIFSEDEESYYYIFVRLFGLPLSDLERIYLEMMCIKYSSNVKTLDELVQNGHLLTFRDACNFFEAKESDYEIPECVSILSWIKPFQYPTLDWVLFYCCFCLNYAGLRFYFRMFLNSCRQIFTPETWSSLCCCLNIVRIMGDDPTGSFGSGY